MRHHRESTTETTLSNLAVRRASQCGFDWTGFAERCLEIVVFGSQAAGLQSRSSDLDILIVSRNGISAAVPRLQGLDIICRTEEEILSNEWLTSEIAGHIADYGRWLQGTSQWRTRALEMLGKDSCAAEAKQRRVERLASAVRRHWDRLTPDFRQRNMITLRREMQRLEILRSGQAVPPTRVLDMAAQGEGELSKLQFASLAEELVGRAVSAAI